jgi:ParB-like nuclease family protein
MGKHHKTALTVQLHRLDTLPTESSPAGKFIRYEYLLRPMSDPITVALAIRVLERWKARKLTGKRAHAPVLKIYPTQAGAFIDKIRKDILTGKLSKPVLLWRHKGRLYLLDGHHRVAAAVLLGIERLPALVV